MVDFLRASICAVGCIFIKMKQTDLFRVGWEFFFFPEHQCYVERRIVFLLIGNTVSVCVLTTRRIGGNLFLQHDVNVM